VNKILSDIIARCSGSAECSEQEKKIYQEWSRRKNPSKGLGDTIKKFTDALQIPQCGSCKRRQEFLNKKFPYKKFPYKK